MWNVCLDDANPVTLQRRNNSNQDNFVDSSLLSSNETIGIHHNGWVLKRSMEYIMMLSEFKWGEMKFRRMMYKGHWFSSRTSYMKDIERGIFFVYPYIPGIVMYPTDPHVLMIQTISSVAHSQILQTKNPINELHTEKKATTSNNLIWAWDAAKKKDDSVISLENICLFGCVQRPIASCCINLFASTSTTTVAEWSLVW